LATLGHLSLVTPATDTGTGAAVLVHRLVQAVMRQRLVEKRAAEVSRDQALNRMAAAFPYAFRDPTVWPLCRALLPNMRTLIGHFPADHAVPELSRLLGLTGSYLLGSGDAASAVPLYRRALESRERVLGAEHPDTLTSVNNLAGCLQTLGDAAGALPLYRRALESRERVLGAEHPDTLGSVNNLAYCLETLGDAAGALPLYRRALESRERVLGAEHPDTLTSVNNLAGCLQTLGDAAEALKLYRRALEGIERRFGSDHPTTRTIRGNYERLARDMGQQGGTPVRPR
jgi:tetratricopeptide (TPR) repeat protein